MNTYKITYRDDKKPSLVKAHKCQSTSNGLMVFITRNKIVCIIPIGIVRKIDKV